MSAKEAIKSLSEIYAAAHQIGDGAALARMFSDDAIIIPPGKPAIVGREAIDAFFAGVTGGADLKTETAQIEVDQTIGYDYGTASWLENGERRYLVYADIYRLEDGEWKIQLTTWNTSEGISL